MTFPQSSINWNKYFTSLNAIWEMLANKADKEDLDVLKDYVVEYYKNGSSWYRLYKSGWLEQGGALDVGGADNRVIKYLKKYKDTSYTAIVVTNDGYNDDAGGDGTYLVFAGGTFNGAYPYGRGVDGMRISIYNRAHMGASWYTAGYMA